MYSRNGTSVAVHPVRTRGWSRSIRAAMAARRARAASGEDAVREPGECVEDHVVAAFGDVRPESGGVHRYEQGDLRRPDALAGSTPTISRGSPPRVTLTPDDVRGAAEPALPEGVADHDHIGRVRLVIGGHQSTAHQWKDVNDVKEPLVDECNLDTLGIIETGEIGIAGLPEGQLGEQSGLPTPVFRVGEAHCRAGMSLDRFCPTGTNSRSACGNGIGRNSTASRVPRTAVVPPMPRASARTAAIVKLGCRHSDRNA